MLVVAPAASFHHHHQRAAAAAADGGGGGDHPGFALLSAGQCAALEDQAKSGSAIQFWQQHSQPTTPPAAAGVHKKHVPAIDYGSGGGGSSGSAGSTTCNDCGNQAKKDCPHQRCRTCCKSRGFDCTTHVRSTWIPAARRREKQQLPGGDGNLSPPAAPAAAASKKPRLLSSQTTTATTSTSNGTSSSQQDAPFRDSLPRQLRAPAVFRCVRVTSVEDGEAEFAYQAAVCINGHMFKGFLYDQGADDGRAGNDEHASGHAHAHAAAVRSISDLHLGSASAVPPDMYNTVSGALILGGLGHGNTMKASFDS